MISVNQRNIINLQNLQIRLARAFTVFTPPEAMKTGPGLTGGPGAVPGGVTWKSGQGHMRVQRGSFPIAAAVCVCVCVCVSVYVQVKKNCQIIQIKHTHFPAQFSNTPNTHMPPPRCPWATRPTHARCPKRLPLGAEGVCSIASKCKLPTTHNNHHHHHHRPSTMDSRPVASGT